MRKYLQKPFKYIQFHNSTQIKAQHNLSTQDAIDMEVVTEVGKRDREIEKQNQKDTSE